MVPSSEGFMEWSLQPDHQLNVQFGWLSETAPDSKIHGAKVGPIWGLQDPGGPHVGPMNIVIWDLKVSIYGCQVEWAPFYCNKE